MDIQPNENKSSIAYKLMSQLQEGEYDIIYNGAFSSQIVTYLLSLSECQLEKLDLKRTVFKKIYFVIVEILQNISRHQAITNNLEIDRQGLFILKRVGRYYHIITGNTIVNKDIEKIEKKIELINSKDEAGLQAYYNEILVDGNISDRGGAGLGLIAIARKSKQKIASKFISIKKNISYFLFTVFVEIEPELVAPKSSIQILNEIADLRNSLLTKNLTLHYFRYVDHIAFLKLFIIVNRQLSGRPYVVRRTVSTFIEMNQNMAYYSSEVTYNGRFNRPGLTLLEEDEEYYRISTANYVDNKHVDLLKKKLAEVNKLEKQEFNDAFKQILEDQLFIEVEKPDLSFLEMRIATRHKLNYILTKVSEDYTFFELMTTIDKY